MDKEHSNNCTADKDIIRRMIDFAKCGSIMTMVTYWYNNEDIVEWEVMKSMMLGIEVNDENFDIYSKESMSAFIEKCKILGVSINNKLAKICIGEMNKATRKSSEYAEKIEAEIKKQIRGKIIIETIVNRQLMTNFALADSIKQLVDSGTKFSYRDIIKNIMAKDTASNNSISYVGMQISISVIFKNNVKTTLYSECGYALNDIMTCILETYEKSFMEIRDILQEDNVDSINHNIWKVNEMDKDELISKLKWVKNKISIKEVDSVLEVIAAFKNNQ